MSRFFQLAGLVLVVFATLLTACSESEKSSAEPLVTGLPDFTLLVEKEGPAVVNISTVTHRDANSMREQMEQIPELFRRFFDQFGGGEMPSMISTKVLKLFASACFGFKNPWDN